MFRVKLNGATYRQITQQFDLSCHTAVVHCGTRTALGRFRYPGYPGGADPYLSEVDQHKFARFVEDAVDHGNCLASPVAVQLAHHLASARAKDARTLLRMAGCFELSLVIRTPEPPCKSWLCHFSSTIGISVLSARVLDNVRRASCDVWSITYFFEKFGYLFLRDERLIFNMDETGIQSKKKFKVLCGEGRIPLSCSQMRIPHLTACVTISAAGCALKPLIILPNKKKIDDLIDFCPNTAFATSASGWMTKSLFTFWVILFVAEVQIYRLSLPPQLRDRPILLIVDGHASRMNFDAAYILHIFNIDCLVLPGHCSHVLQPFDVNMASR